MANQTKGGMYCHRCATPVLAVRTTHRARNTAAGFGTVATGGMSLLFAKRDP
jgi:hypothetical protein